MPHWIFTCCIAFICVATSQLGYANLQKAQLFIANKAQFDVEIVETVEERRIGLSGCLHMDSSSGMLFVYNKPLRHQFWMKRMHFPIDIIWIRERKIVKITCDIPIPEEGASDFQLIKYSSDYSVDWVLEINAGEAKKKGIQVGDVIQVDFN